MSLSGKSEFSKVYTFKKKVDQFGANTHIIHGKKEEIKLAAFLKSPDYFTQEIITGNTEYATHIIFKEVVCCFKLFRSWF